MSHSIEDLRYEITLLIGKLKNPEPLLEELGTRVIESLRYGFRESKGPDNEHWPEIKHREGKPLIDTGRLRRSLGHQLSSDKRTLYIGTNVKYARIHNEGFDDNVAIKAHTRRITKAFGKNIKPKTIDVKAHTARRYVQQRRFLGLGTRQTHAFKKALNFWANKAVGDFK